MKVGVKLCRAAISFTAVLNSAARSAAAKARFDGDGRFVNARPGFRVETLQGNVEGGQRFHDLQHQAGVGGGAQHAVAEHAGGQRGERGEMFVAQSLRGLAKDEEFVFRGEKWPYSRGRRHDRARAESTCRGAMGSGRPSRSQKSRRKNAVPGSHGTSR
jgi:hypothetical protein